MTNLDCQAWLQDQYGHLLPPQAWTQQVPPVAAMAQLLPDLPHSLQLQDAQLTAAMKNLGGYEAFIDQHGTIPTRPDNWHDWYNALCWQLFPRTKEALHRSQVQYPPQPGAKNGRSPQQNGATLFDENGVLLVTQASWVVAALRQHDWQTLFTVRREELLQVAHVWFLGHALWEQLRAPFCGLTAKWLAVDLSPTASIQAVDAAAAQLPPMRPQQLGNLPILGWPGLCAANADPGFYDNTDYFRPARRLS